MAEQQRSPLVLSKSKYLAGLQCPKLLWYQYNRKAEMPPIDAATQAIFDEGNRVGALAQSLFPDGIRIERERVPAKQMEKSLAAMAQRRPLFEAGFVHQRAYALADVLVPAADGAWDLIEVKSSTQVKPEHYRDAAFQKYTYQGAGLKIRRCFIMHINNQYVRRGMVEPEKLFRKEDISQQVDGLSAGIEKDLAALLRVIGEKNVPEIKVGPQCNDPRACPLKDLCWSFLPDEGHVFILYRGGRQRYELLERGILRIEDIPPAELNDKQAVQVHSHRTGNVHIDKAAIREFLAGLAYPLYFLDFETIAPAIPVYDETRPYQEVPFQFSLYEIKKEGAPPAHFAYLAPGDVDPRPEVLKRLQALLGKSGSILAYNASFEQRCIRNAAEVYTDYADWAEKVGERFVDLLEPFKSMSFYHPGQGGSASLKSVLPAITGSTYEGLEIAEGQTAAAEYYRVTFGTGIDPAERQRVRAALEKYCDLDTSGMIEIIEALKQESA